MYWRYTVSFLLLLLVELSLCRHILKRSLDLDDSLVHMNDDYLPRYVIPRGYKLSLIVDPDQGRFTGTVWINITCVEPTSNIVLHASENFTFFHDDSSVIHFIGDDDPQAHIESSLSSSKKNLFKNAVNDRNIWYNISLHESLQKGRGYQIKLSYAAYLNNETETGLFVRSWNPEGNAKNLLYAATDMKSTKARNVFPCFDEPSYKVPFQISIGAWKEYKVISNMQIKEETDMTKPGWRVCEFETSPPISTFSVGIALLKLHMKAIQLNDTEETITFYAQPTVLRKIGKVVDFVVKYIRALESYLNVPIPTEKLDVIILPNYTETLQADSWGFILLRDEDILTEYWHITVARLITTQWFGHYATPLWYSNSPVVADTIRYVSGVTANQVCNCRALFHNFYYIWYGNPDSNFTRFQNSDRALFVFRMLNYTLSGKNFKQALNTFLEDRKFKVFTEIDFWNTFKYEGIATGKIDKDFDIISMVESWMNNDRYPVVSVTRNYKQRSAYVEQHVLLRDCSKEDTEKNLLFYVPIMYITEENMNINSIRTSTWMKNEKKILIENLPKEEKFIVLNPEEIGMFIVNYDARNWVLLANYLQQGNGTLLSVATRAKLLNDALTLAYAGELRYDVALDMTLFLKRETTFKVWDPYSVMVDHLSRRIEGTNAGNLFQEYTLMIYKDLMRRLGKEKPEENKKTKELKNTVKYIIKRFTNETYESKYKDIISDWMQNDSLPNITVTYSESTEALMQALKWGTKEEFDFILSKILSKVSYPETTTDLEYIRYLAGSTRGVKKIKRFLSLTLLNYRRNSSDMALRVIFSQCWGHWDGHIGLFEFVTENWDALKIRYENNTKVWQDMLHSALNFKTQEGLNQAKEFYIQKKGQFGSAEETVQKEIKKVERLADWSNKNLPVMESWLSQHLPETADT